LIVLYVGGGCVSQQCSSPTLSDKERAAVADEEQMATSVDEHTNVLARCWACVGPSQYHCSESVIALSRIPDPSFLLAARTVAAAETRARAALEEDPISLCHRQCHLLHAVDARHVVQLPVVAASFLPSLWL